MLSKFFGKKEPAMQIHRTNGIVSVAPSGMQNDANICRTVESAVSSIERTGQALVPDNDKVLIGSIIEKLWGV